MAHSKPTEIANRGDAQRVTTIAGYFIVELCTDPRVKECYAVLRAARAHQNSQGCRELDERLTRPGPGDGEAAVRAWIKDWWRPHDEQARVLLQRFVREILRLDMPWVADNLLHVFLNVWLYNELHPADPPKLFSIPVYLVPDTPKGRGLRADGQDLKRAVRWYYRAKVKEPPDTVHDLARDYASWANRDNDCRSVVQNGIDQVQAILDLMTKHAVCVPPGSDIVPDT